MRGPRPTLLLFEDAHWADPTSLDLLARFIELLPGIPALLVITARPEFNAALVTSPGRHRDKSGQIHAGTE